MTFVEVKKTLARLEVSLSAEIGRRVIAHITVDEPVGEEDELHFCKLVAWSYILLNEAGQECFRHLFALLRSSDPAVFQQVSRSKENVHNLRTVRAHNLPDDGSRNTHQKRQAAVWVRTAGGDCPDWSLCSRALCTEMVDLLDALSQLWAKVSESDEDRPEAISQLEIALSDHWPPHWYDSVLAEGAASLGIDGLDIPEYRNYRLNAWRETARFFLDIESKRAAMKAFIHQELRSKFGEMIK